MKRFSLINIICFVLLFSALWVGFYQLSIFMHDNRLKVVASQVLGYRKAVLQFRENYGFLPGDSKRVPEWCPKYGLVCKPWPEAAGDGIIGSRQFSKTWKSPVPHKTSDPGVSAEDETVLFWFHLLHGQLIGGLSPVGLKNGTSVAWHVTHPEAYGQPDAGFIVGYWDGGPLPKELSPSSKGMKGNVLVLITGRVLRGEAEMHDSGGQPLTPLEAKFIDKKIDDGSPSTGEVQAYGTMSCFLNNAGEYAYNESTSERVCGLIFDLAGTPGSKVP